jgi:hypothetical protein
VKKCRLLEFEPGEIVFMQGEKGKRGGKVRWFDLQGRLTKLCHHR